MIDLEKRTETAGLQVRDLHTTFGSRSSRTKPIQAVRGVDLDIEPGQTYVLLGESGSGKSVTARSILRLYGDKARTSGTVTLGDTDLTALSRTELRAVRGRRIAMVAQDPTAALDPLRTIGSQLVEVLRVHGVEPSKLDAKHRARQLLAMVGIPDPQRVFTSRPHQLSGGLRQRAVIALAIACGPELLIADEPTTALDVTIQATVLELFLDLQRRTGMSLLLVTHDVGVAEELGGRIGVMYAGRLVETGETRDVLTNPRHPYTRGLLESLPKPGVPRGELPMIAGRPPLTGEATPGCAFSLRCPLAEKSCYEEVPTLIQIGADRTVACPVVNPGSVLASAVSA
jgi:oligopeptide/dipeptide ABC transporter ATP-binding protein